MQTVCLYCGDEDDPPGYVPMIRFRCGVCYSPYCSEACLLTDRRAHRRECRDLNLPNWFRLKRGAVAQLAPSASAYHGLAMCYHFGRGTPEESAHFSIEDPGGNRLGFTASREPARSEK